MRHLIELLESLVAKRPEDTAFIFLKDGNKDEVRWTYAQLAQRGKQIAEGLRPYIKPGDRVLINHAPGLEYVGAFFGCLYAGATAVPVYPPRFNAKLDRLNAIVEDASPTVALTSSLILENIQPLFPENPSLNTVRWLDTDLLSETVNDFRLPSIDESSLAFMQYTSGSTAQPKGVMLSQANVMANLRCIRDFFEVGPDDVGVIWLPPYHDMGLVGGILGALYSGIPTVLMSPYTVALRPFRWLRAISKYRGSISGGPNFAFDLCTERVTDEQIAELDLSSWKVAFCGAEPIRTDVLDRFTKKFEKCGFSRAALYPCYGLAETTLIVSGGKRALPPVLYQLEGEKQARVGCGQALEPHVIRIVDPETHMRCADGEVGEIWFSGPSVAQGYWNRRDDDTKATFSATIEGATDGMAYLRTGDLGFLHEGELFISGRIKDLIIFRGRNLYPHDIELTVERSHDQLRAGNGAAFAVTTNEQERLVIVHEVAKKSEDAELNEIIEAIRRRVMEDHGVAPFAISLVHSNTIPVTSSGKIQRHASRDHFLTGRLSERRRFVEEPMPGK